MKALCGCMVIKGRRVNSMDIEAHCDFHQGMITSMLGDQEHFFKSASPEIVSEVKRLYRRGHSCANIARLLDYEISRWTVARMVQGFKKEEKK